MDGGRMPLVHPILPMFLWSRNVPVADQRTRHREGRRDEETSGQALFSARDRQLRLHRPPRGRMPDERKPLDLGPGSLLSRWLGTPLPSVQVHSGAFTNRLLQAYHADAMTVGRDIYIKTDKFDPHSAAGLALLAHEFTHVSQQLPGSGEAMHMSPNRQEEKALTNERLVLLHAQAHLGAQNLPAVPHAPGSAPVSPPPRPRGSPAVPAGPGLTPGVPHHTQARSATPMFAEGSRSMAAADPVSLAPPIAAGLSDHDMARIKAEVYQDLMWRIKTEFERGS